MSLSGSYEIQKEHLQVNFTRVLGTGAFGKVHSGWLTSVAANKEVVHPLVAIKVPLNGKDKQQQSMLLEELKIMMTVGRHVNVLSLIGACTENMVEGELMVVVEYCTMDSMKTYLNERCVEHSIFRSLSCTQYWNRTVPIRNTTYCIKRRRIGNSQLLKSKIDPPTPMTFQFELLSFALQIANGMDFLGQKLIHRDLATRNLLLTKKDGFIIVKIADYGLSRHRQEYSMVKRDGGGSVYTMPVCWMAPEFLIDGNSSVKSDVWSFGVVLWEIYSLGKDPNVYNDEQLCNPPEDDYVKELVSFLESDGRLELLDRSCPGIDFIIQLMNDCWHLEAQNRPTFFECLERLKDEMNSNCPEQVRNPLFQQLFAGMIHEGFTYFESSSGLSQATASATNTPDEVEVGSSGDCSVKNYT